MPYDIILPSAVRTTGANQVSGTISVDPSADLRAELDVTASTAPTTLDVKVQHSSDGGTNWYDLATFTQVGAVGTARQSLPIQGPTSGVIRVLYTIVGTNYTFSVAIRRA